MAMSTATKMARSKAPEMVIARDNEVRALLKLGSPKGDDQGCAETLGDPDGEVEGQVTMMARTKALKMIDTRDNEVRALLKVGSLTSSFRSRHMLLTMKAPLMANPLP